MKIAAIYCVWSGDDDLLLHSIDKIRTIVDGVIIVFSNKSNYGEVIEIGLHHINTYIKFDNQYWFNWEPYDLWTPIRNETEKRNYGIKRAFELGFTHFVMMDADEFYLPDEFIKAKELIGDKAGLVCRSKVYFREPTLTIGYDTTLVPFIHKLTPDIKCEFNKQYPFAWTDTDGVPFTPKKRIRIDPTRSFNIRSDVYWSDITMHHMSWIRSDIKKKIRNSTAKANIERSTILQDYLQAKQSYYCQFYGKLLEECPNVFGIPKIIDDNVGTTV